MSLTARRLVRFPVSNEELTFTQGPTVRGKSLEARSFEKGRRQTTFTSWDGRRSAMRHDIDADDQRRESWTFSVEDVHAAAAFATVTAAVIDTVVPPTAERTAITLLAVALTVTVEVTPHG